jgi:hypothetical protein
METSLPVIVTVGNSNHTNKSEESITWVKLPPLASSDNPILRCRVQNLFHNLFVIPIPSAGVAIAELELELYMFIIFSVDKLRNKQKCDRSTETFRKHTHTYTIQMPNLYLFTKKICFPHFLLPFTTSAVCLTQILLNH